ncbi:hypothetical protein [Aphanizomenon sp. UHCC 0183]|uniref:hypothetical protein n=1 Tax=Aphanizomenon sp. UHCC 0183 TaxID=2590028 RepID=UPI00144642D8|nr:hypothetical protein [Aphanizomenon sp. UHCC 0183]
MVSLRGHIFYFHTSIYQYRGFWFFGDRSQQVSRLVLKIVVMARQKALMQEARLKRVWAILHFFTQFGFIVFTYL